MAKKYARLSYGEVKNYFESVGYELLSKDYRGTEFPLKFKDKNGYLYCLPLYSLKLSLSKDGTPLPFSGKFNLYAVNNLKLLLRNTGRDWDLLFSKITEYDVHYDFLCNNCKLKFSKTLTQVIISGDGCVFCNGRNKLSYLNSLQTMAPELALEFDLEKNYPLTPNDVTCKSNNEAWWICSKCNYSWKALIENRYVRKNGKNCPQCSGVVVSDKNRIFMVHPELEEDWDYEKNLGIDPFNVSYGTAKKFWWKCNICGYKWKSSPCHRSRGSGCVACSDSHGEKKIEYFLKTNRFSYVREYRIKECKNKKPLPFDFAIFINDKITLIEYQGSQHYIPFAKFGNEKSLEIQRERDEIKRKYCQDNNIKLLIIPYWELKNVEKILTEYFL